MEHFNAQEARKIVDSLHSDELIKILTYIKKQAEKGEYVLYLHYKIKPETKKALQEKGFIVEMDGSFGFKSPDVYCVISW